MTKCILLIMLATILAADAKADEPPRFVFPVACRLGENCWTVNYADADAAAGSAADFRCGTQSYDGHDGTDFAVRDTRVMEEGVDVLAAGDGTVLRVRDSVIDREPSQEQLAKMLADKKGCGNGVVIDHGSGWQSIYCHMKQGSIAVRPRQRVKGGDPIGKIGQSGAAEFPHLHFGVMHAGRKVDPFTGAEIGAAKCGTDNVAPMWAAGSGIRYAPFSLYAAGFMSGVADFEQIKKDAGTPAKLQRSDLNALTFWMVYFGAARNDRVHIEVTGPNGQLFARQDTVQKKDRARQFYFVGRKVKGSALTPGIYTGTAKLMREGSEVAKREIVETVMLE